LFDFVSAPLSCADPTTRQLASEIAASLGTKLGDISIKAFADGEIGIQIQESVRGLDTYVVACLQCCKFFSY
jgi:phosphoribosylpyrophosphate synthetase